MILLISLAFAEPYRATATFTGGLQSDTPNFDLTADYGVIRHVAVAAEAGVDLRGGHSLGLGALVLPIDNQWWRAGIALVPELVDPFDGELDVRGRVGVRAGWLAFWGVGLAGRADVLLSVDQPPAIDWGLGLSVRM